MNFLFSCLRHLNVLPLAFAGLVGLASFSAAALAAADGKAAVAEIGRRGDAAVAAYTPQKHLATAAEFSRLYFDVFEGAGMELDLGIRASKLKTEIEVLFGQVNDKAMRGAPPGELDAAWQALRARLLDAAALYDGERESGFWPVFAQSLLILLREGAEAMLVVAALATYLRRAGSADRLWVIYAGAGVAVPLSLVTGWAFIGMIQSASASRVATEGATMIFAACVLCYVSFWLFSKREAKRWQGWIAGQVDAALSNGSLATLGGASCLAVYREGAETVLFYHALAAGSAGQMPALALGIAAAAALLVAGVAIFRLFAMRIPYRLFFGATAILLYGMAVVFMGQGIVELQAGGYIGAFHLPGVPQVSWLGLAPTLQGAGTQAAMLLLPVLAWLWPRPRAAAGAAS
ncbi:MAG: FTR1 family protein [Candidatus Accumulibacter sp.]|jgi:high-affinity iron transporter|nr:FTR1 family protein [Accumulibacter sp.]